MITGQSRNPTRFTELGTDADNARRLDVVEQRMNVEFIRKPWFQSLGIKTDKTGRITEISGDLIVGGILQSTNWGDGAGSKFDLINGTIRLGGDTNPALSWNGSTLSIRGSVAIIGGTISIGTDPSAFHVDSLGNAWWGAATYAAAPARISKDGVGFFSDLTVSGYVPEGGSASDINAGTGTISGTKIAANTISVATLNFVPLVSVGSTASIIASINASTEGLRITGSKITIDGSVTFAGGYDPTSKVSAGGAANDINANVTLINGGRIDTNTLVAKYVQAGISISSPSISAATINASSIYGSYINGATVVGATIRTSDGATRIEFNSGDVTRMWMVGDGVVVGSIKVWDAASWELITEPGKLFKLRANAIQFRGYDGGNTTLDVPFISSRVTGWDINVDHANINGTSGAGYLYLQRQNAYCGAPSGDGVRMYIIADSATNCSLWLTRGDGKKAKVTVGTWA